MYSFKFVVRWINFIPFFTGLELTKYSGQRKKCEPCSNSQKMSPGCNFCEPLVKLSSRNPNKWSPKYSNMFISSDAVRIAIRTVIDLSALTWIIWLMFHHVPTVPMKYTILTTFATMFFNSRSELYQIHGQLWFCMCDYTSSVIKRISDMMIMMDIYFQMVGILCCIWCVAYIFFACVCM